MRKIRWMLGLLLAWIVSPGYAAGEADEKEKGKSVLNVVMEQGGRTVFFTGEVQKLTFSGGNLIIHESTGNTQFYDMDWIQSLNFRNYPVLTSVRSIVHSPGLAITLYPNPAGDMLFFRGYLAGQEDVRVEVLSLNGRVLLSERLSGTWGNISLINLEPGLYICRIHSANEVSSSKFLKR